MQDIMPPVDTIDNLFHNGNPITGEQGTIVSAEYLNNQQGATRDTQTELKSILTAAGITIDPDNQEQVLTALSKLYLSRVNPGADISADGEAAIATFLSNLGLGEAAKRDVGTGSKQLPDMSAFGNSAAVNGYQKLPGGVTIQWGSFPVTPSSGGVGTTDVTWPLAFPVAFRAVSAIVATNDPSARFVGFDLANTSRTKIRFTHVSNTANSIYWVAVGY